MAAVVRLPGGTPISILPALALRVSVPVLVEVSSTEPGLLLFCSGLTQRLLIGRDGRGGLLLLVLCRFILLQFFFGGIRACLSHMSRFVMQFVFLLKRFLRVLPRRLILTVEGDMGRFRLVLVIPLGKIIVCPLSREGLLNGLKLQVVLCGRQDDRSFCII